MRQRLHSRANQVIVDNRSTAKRIRNIRQNDNMSQSRRWRCASSAWQARCVSREYCRTTPETCITLVCRCSYRQHFHNQDWDAQGIQIAGNQSQSFILHLNFWSSFPDKLRFVESIAIYPSRSSRIECVAKSRGHEMKQSWWQRSV